MKTTLNLPDELMREVKMRAVQQNRRLQEVIAELLRIGLASGTQEPARHRVALPLIHCAKVADFTPEQVAQFLIDQEADDAVR